MTHTIQTEIELLESTKEEIGVAIMEKGVAVSDSDKFSAYPTRIRQISTIQGNKDDLFRSLLEKSATYLNIPQGTRYIAPYRFYEMYALRWLIIPSSVEIISYNAFVGCTSLDSIEIKSTTPPMLYNSLGEEPFDNTNDCPIYVPEDSVLDYQIAWPQYAHRIQAKPALMDKAVLRLRDGTSVTIQDDGNYELNQTEVNNALSNVGATAEDVVYVEIGQSVTSIGTSAFNKTSNNVYFSNLEHVEIPDTVTEIKNLAFYYSGLTEVTIPDSVTSIGSNAFEDCINLERVYLGSGLFDIGQYCFGSHAFGVTSTKLTEVFCSATTPPSQYQIFDGEATGYIVNENLAIYVPSESLESYRFIANAWYDYADRIFVYGVPDWKQVSECEVDANTGRNTGYVIYSDTDANPSSPTYGQTAATQRVYDETTCNIVTYFRLIDNTSKVTSGKYLITNNGGTALNASLLPSTTSSSDGINSSTNYVSVTLATDPSTGEYVIEANSSTMALAFDYDASTGLLSMTDNGATYYLYPSTSISSYFNTNTRNQQQASSYLPFMYPYYINSSSDTRAITFANTQYTTTNYRKGIGITSSHFGCPRLSASAFSSLKTILFKLDE